MLIKYYFLEKKAYGTKNSFKDFIRYNYNDFISLLYAKLPQMTGYARKFDKNATMSFKVNDKKLLKNYSKIVKYGKKLKS